MSNLSPESRALLKGARREFEANADQQARVGRSLSMRLGIAAGTVAATTTSASTAAGTGAGGAGTAGAGAGMGAAGSALLVGTKWVGATLLVGALGAGGVSAYRAEHRAPILPKAPQVVLVMPIQAPSISVPASGAVSPAVDTPPEPSVTLLPQTASSQERAAPSTRGISHGPARAGTVAEETRLLRRADEALRTGDAAHALVLLDEHARTFPNGVLAEERSAERVLTLCKLGRKAQARTEATRFLRATPDSPLAQSIRSSCGTFDEEEGR